MHRKFPGGADKDNCTAPAFFFLKRSQENILGRETRASEAKQLTDDERPNASRKFGRATRLRQKPHWCPSHMGEALPPGLRNISGICTVCEVTQLFSASTLAEHQFQDSRYFFLVCRTVRSSEITASHVCHSLVCRRSHTGD